MGCGNRGSTRERGGRKYGVGRSMETRKRGTPCETKTRGVGGGEGEYRQKVGCGMLIEDEI